MLLTDASNRTTTHTSVTKCPENIDEAGYKCVRLNARRIVNKKNVLNITEEYFDHHIFSITELWANTKT